MTAMGNAFQRPRHLTLAFYLGNQKSALQPIFSSFTSGGEKTYSIL
jgi:hypothetical protein